MASGLTPTYLLPFPEQTDPVDVASDVEDLATAVETTLLTKAPINSPTLTGTPLSTTPADNDNSTKIATTAFVKNQNYLTVATASSTYAPLASPTLTGSPTAPTAALGTSTTQIATTAFVANALANFVTLPTQSGQAGKWLKTDGTNASWQTIQQSDVSGLSAALAALPNTYAPINFSIVNRTGSFTLILSMVNSLVTMNNSSSATITLPSDATEAFAIGSSIAFCRVSASAVTFAAEAGATVLYTPGLSMRAQGSFVTAIKYASNAWIITGDLV